MIQVWVPGLPRPQGSKRIVQSRWQRKPVMVEVCKGLDVWRRMVTLRALGARKDWVMPEEAEVSLRFLLPRPPSHVTRRGNQRKGAPTRPIGRGTGDLDKLTRAVFDAITNVLIRDDATVVSLHAEKLYAREIGCLIIVRDAAALARAAA